MFIISIVSKYNFLTHNGRLLSVTHSLTSLVLQKLFEPNKKKNDDDDDQTIFWINVFGINFPVIVWQCADVSLAVINNLSTFLINLL